MNHNFLFTKDAGIILLTGGTGNLGRHIIQSGLFGNILSPSRSELDLCDENTIAKYFANHQFKYLIHTAAEARIVKCQKNPEDALVANLIGTSNLVKAILKKNRNEAEGIKLIYISTDAVYSGEEGNYSELSPTIPKSHYGWTKLGGECAVNLLGQFVIIRTRFFNPKEFKFRDASYNTFNSSIQIENLVKAIYVLLYGNFVGTINVGDCRNNDFDRFKKFLPALERGTWEEIFSGLPFVYPVDSSMNVRKWKNIEKAYFNYENK